MHPTHTRVSDKYTKSTSTGVILIILLLALNTVNLLFGMFAFFELAFTSQDVSKTSPKLKV